MNVALPRFQPVLPAAVIIGVAAVALVVALLCAIFGKALTPAWIRTPMLLLRTNAIALIAFFLLNPSDAMSVRSQESHTVVLLDESASMSLGAPTRWDEACAWIAQFRGAMTAAGLEPPGIIGFAADVQPAPNLAAGKPFGVPTNLANAIERVISAAGKTAPAQLIVVSDGRAHDRSALPRALAIATARHTAISTLAVGSDTPPRNAGIAAVSVPRVVRPNARVTVQVELAISGYAPGELLSLALKDENGRRLGNTNLQAPVPDAPPAEWTFSFESGLRTSKYMLEIAPDSHDVAPEDNRFEFTVEVATSKLRVLFVEGSHAKRSVGTNGYWWNDMELMTRAWDATGEIEYTCLTPLSAYFNSPNLVGVSFANGEMILDRSRTFPGTREEVHRFDVLMISDIPVGNFSTEQMEWVVDWVLERGGGFFMGGGSASFDVGHYDQTPWERITPVDMLAFGDGFNEQRFKVEIPKAARKHPTWRIVPDPDQNDEILDSHPDFTGMNRIRRAKPGAFVLMTRPSLNKEPVIAAQQYGRGRAMAYLGDPNGSWAKFLVGWGPPGGPAQGPQTELGHGDRFRVNIAATETANGPPPPHPSPYYAQYWVNVVKWLGENSVRWRRDKLAGRTAAAQAQRGRYLPVAAEVLSVTNPDALLGLNVGARLDLPGSPRICLEYDRDRREFVGNVPVPMDLDEGEITVVFDAVAGGDSLTDAVRVGVRHANPEFVETMPDRAFLAELAKAGGGHVINSIVDAVGACRDAARARAQETQETWSQPAWVRWPWWGALATLLCAEWALRRRAATHAAVALLMLLTPPTRAQELTASEAEIRALIEQLGASRVRLRDEAEEKLKGIPAAFDAVKAAATNSPNIEIKLRARNVAQILRQNLWQAELEGQGHAPQPSVARRIVVHPDGRHFYTRGEDHIRAWDAETCAPGITFGEPAAKWQDWQRGGPLATLAVSPDGQRLVSTDASGNIIMSNPENGVEIKRFANRDPGSPPAAAHLATIWNAAFFPDGKRLATLDRGGFLRMWSVEDGALLTSIAILRPQVGRALAISPDGNLVVCSSDWANDPNHLCVWNMQRAEWAHRQQIETRAATLAFSRDGKRLLAANFGGFANLWSVSAAGVLSDRRRFGRVGNQAYGAIFSADEKSIFAVADAGDGQLSQWDIETGEELWRSPTLVRGHAGIALLGPDRIATLGLDERVRVWQRRAVPKPR